MTFAWSLEDELEDLRARMKHIEAIANQPTKPMPEGDSVESRLHRIWMLASGK